jgi:hypothetical protein
LFCCDDVNSFRIYVNFVFANFTFRFLFHLRQQSILRFNLAALNLKNQQIPDQWKRNGTRELIEKTGRWKKDPYTGMVVDHNKIELKCAFNVLHLQVLWSSMSLKTWSSYRQFSYVGLNLRRTWDFDIEWPQPLSHLGFRHADVPIRWPVLCQTQASALFVTPRVPLPQTSDILLLVIDAIAILWNIPHNQINNA